MNDLNLIVAVVAIVGLVVSFFQWHVSQNYRRLDQRFDEWAEKVATVEKVVAKQEQVMERTRDELHRDYVTSKVLTDMRHEIRQDFDNVFKRLTGVSRDIERLIGAHSKNLMASAND